MDITATAQEVRRLGAGGSVYDLIFTEIKTRLMRDTVPKFYKHFAQPTESAGASASATEPTFEDFCLAIDQLHAHYLIYLTIAGRAQHLRDSSDCCAETELNRWLRAALLAQLPLHFDRLVYTYFDYSFRVFSGTTAANEQDSEMNGELVKDEFSCHICEAESFGCKCTAVLRAFQDTNRKLLELGIMERLCGPTVAHLVEEKIESLTAEMCQGMLRSNSRLLENWLDKVVLEWLRRIYQFGAEYGASTSPSPVRVDCEALLATFGRYKHRLEHFLCETYARIIVDQFFNIIIGKLAVCTTSNVILLMRSFRRLPQSTRTRAPPSTTCACA